MSPDQRKPIIVADNDSGILMALDTDSKLDTTIKDTDKYNHTDMDTDTDTQWSARGSIISPFTIKRDSWLYAGFFSPHFLASQVDRLDPLRFVLLRFRAVIFDCWLPLTYNQILKIHGG